MCRLKIIALQLQTVFIRRTPNIPLGLHGHYDNIFGVNAISKPHDIKMVDGVLCSMSMAIVIASVGNATQGSFLARHHIEVVAGHKTTRSTAYCNLPVLVLYCTYQVHAARARSANGDEQG